METRTCSTTDVCSLLRQQCATSGVADKNLRPGRLIPLGCAAVTKPLMSCINRSSAKTAQCTNSGLWTNINIKYLLKTLQFSAVSGSLCTEGGNHLNLTFPHHNIRQKQILKKFFLVILVLLYCTVRFTLGLMGRI